MSHYDRVRVSTKWQRVIIELLGPDAEPAMVVLSVDETRQIAGDLTSAVKFLRIVAPDPVPLKLADFLRMVES